MERNSRGRPRHPDVLTPAEWRVLEALREGGTNAEIGARLGIGAETVKYHIANMLAKLELRDRRALASWRPEERRGRLGAWFAVPAALWSVARPIAWVGAGTAAVAGVVVGVVAVVALVAVALVVAGGDGDPPLALAPSPTQTPQSTSTPAPTPTPATASPSPTPTPATATPMPTPPAPTSTPTLVPTSSPTPSATNLPVAAPLPTREELGIHEVDAAAAFAAAGLTHVRYEAGDEVPWDPGLFLLDIASGAVEAWVHSLASIPEEERRPNASAPEIAVSPSNRLLELHGVVYDRQTERAYRLGGSLDQWWGSGTSERLLMAVPGGASFVLLDGDLQPVAQFQLPSGERLTGPNGGYILVRGSGSGETFHLVSLEDEQAPEVRTWVLPWQAVDTRYWGPAYRIELLDDLVVFVGLVGDSTCHVTRYNLKGVLISDQPIPCRVPWLEWWGEAGLPRISPDGLSTAVITLDGLEEFGYGSLPVGSVMSIFQAATGTETLRLLGVHPSWVGSGSSGDELVWLADSSGIIVLTRDGPRVAGLDASWGPAPGWASPDTRDVFLDPGTTIPGGNIAAVNQEGDVRASLSFGPPSAVITDPTYDAALILRESVEWGAQSRILRVWTSYFHTQERYDYYPTPPLDSVIEQPPFSGPPTVEVVADACLNVHEEHRANSPIVTCLPNGTVAETDTFESSWASLWMHIRTDDGVEGWAHADYLRWHSDGVRLEE